jgi:4-hydroxy-tetrahydrodipicolinate synthase
VAERTSGHQLARGVFAALATPTRRGNELEVDTGGLFEYLDVIAATGVDGLVLFGATGEFVHFGLEERTRVCTLALKRSRKPLLVNVTHSTLAGAVGLAESAESDGAAGLLLAPPYFFRYSDEQLLAYYREFIRQARPDMPVYLYHMPALTGELTFAGITALLGSGEFAGIQDSSGDWNLFEQLAALRRTMPFQLLLGNESFYLRRRSAGADGIISGLAAAVPELMVALDRDRLESLEQRVLEFLEQSQPFPIPAGIKLAAAARGWNIEYSAVPFSDDLTTKARAFQAWSREWWPAVLAQCKRKTDVRT